MGHFKTTKTSEYNRIIILDQESYRTFLKWHFKFKHKIYCERQIKTKNDLYVYIKSSFQISRVKLFWSLFNFRNKFIKQFAISKKRFLNFGKKMFWEERSHLCKYQTLEPLWIYTSWKPLFYWNSIPSNVLFLFHVFCLQNSHLKAINFLQNFFKQVNLYIKNTSDFSL